MPQGRQNPPQYITSWECRLLYWAIAFHQRGFATYLEIGPDIIRGEWLKAWYVGSLDQHPPHTRTSHLQQTCCYWGDRSVTFTNPTFVIPRSHSSSSLTGGVRDDQHPETRIFVILSGTPRQRSSTHVNSYSVRDTQQVNMQGNFGDEIPHSTQNDTYRTTTVKSSTHALHPRAGFHRPGVLQYERCCHDRRPKT